MALALWVFLDWLEAGADHQEKGFKWLKCRFTTREAWFPKDPERALLMGLVLGLASFWNGAAVIGGLLILCGFALFSDGKLDYALTAGVTVLFTMIQSKIFVTGSVGASGITLVSMQIRLGSVYSITRWPTAVGELAVPVCFALVLIRILFTIYHDFTKKDEEEVAA